MLYVYAYLLMLGFFTRIPVPQVPYSEERYVKGMWLLPCVGGATGALLWCSSQLNRLIPMSVVAVLAFIFYLLITGGIHMDGLGDSCDALFSGRDRDKMLEIMKDSRSGSFGVLGLIAASAAYIVLLRYAPRPAFLLFPIVGKCTPAIASLCSPYIRAKGMAEVFCRNVKPSLLAASCAMALVPCVYFGLKFVAAAVCAFAACAVLTLRVKHVLGGITGDILGLACETAQLVFLLVCVFPF